MTSSDRSTARREMCPRVLRHRSGLSYDDGRGKKFPTACGDGRGESSSKKPAGPATARHGVAELTCCAASYRDSRKMKKETLADLCTLSDDAITALKASLPGSACWWTPAICSNRRRLPASSMSHGARRWRRGSGWKKLLGPDCLRGGPGVRLDSGPGITSPFSRSPPRSWAEPPMWRGPGC